MSRTRSFVVAVVVVVHNHHVGIVHPRESVIAAAVVHHEHHVDVRVLESYFRFRCRKLRTPVY